MVFGDGLINGDIYIYPLYYGNDHPMQLRPIVFWSKVKAASYMTGVSNSRPAGRMRPAKASFAARTTLSGILKNLG